MFPLSFSLAVLREEVLSHKKFCTSVPSQCSVLYRRALLAAAAIEAGW